MINDKTISNDLINLAIDLNEIGNRIKSISTKVAINENSEDGDKLYCIGDAILCQFLDISKMVNFPFTIKNNDGYLFLEKSEDK